MKIKKRKFLLFLKLKVFLGLWEVLYTSPKGSYIACKKISRDIYATPTLIGRGERWEFREAELKAMKKACKID